METIKSTVNLANLMVNAANELRTPAISYGFQISIGCLRRIAMRALEIGDHKIVDELVSIGFVTKRESEVATDFTASE